MVSLAGRVRLSKMPATNGGSDDENDAQSHEEKVSVLIFRLGRGMVGLSHPDRRRGHHAPACPPVPHRSNQVFLGLVNLQGQVQLCVSLHGLLGVTAPSSPARLVVLRDRRSGRELGFRGR